MPGTDIECGAGKTWAHSQSIEQCRQTCEVCAQCHCLRACPTISLGVFKRLVLDLACGAVAGALAQPASKPHVLRGALTFFVMACAVAVRASVLRGALTCGVCCGSWSRPSTADAPRPTAPMLPLPPLSHPHPPHPPHPPPHHPHHPHPPQPQPRVPLPPLLHLSHFHPHHPLPHFHPPPRSRHLDRTLRSGPTHRARSHILQLRSQILKA
eukprot:3898579-Rhodomonas_salina.1